MASATKPGMAAATDLTTASMAGMLATIMISAVTAAADGGGGSGSRQVDSRWWKSSCKKEEEKERAGGGERYSYPRAGLYRSYGLHGLPPLPAESHGILRLGTTTMTMQWRLGKTTTQ